MMFKLRRNLEKVQKCVFLSLIFTDVLELQCVHTPHIRSFPIYRPCPKIVENQKKGLEFFFFEET